MSKVLIVYYTYSQQTGKVADAITEALHARP
jgi:flavodoxin